MADYYPLLAKAVAGLPDSTEEKRRAIYERARKALLGQLRKIDPPIAESDIARENSALDESIARLESEIAGKAAAAPASKPAQPPAAAPPPATLKPPAAAPKPPAPLSSPVPPKPFSFRPPNVAGVAAPVEPPQDDEPKQPTDETAAAIDLKPPRPREAPRPAAPTPAPAGDGVKRMWIVGGVIAAIVLLIAAAAYFMRDHGSQGLARLGQAPPATEAPPSGKIADRLDKPAASSGSAAPAPTQNPGAPQSIPVAGRAALLVEAPDAPDKVKTYVGSVIWRIDSVPTGAGRPLGTAVHADVDIPDAKVRMTLDIQKNEDASLPASHTINVGFNILPGSDIPGVKQIYGIQMRREDSSNGDALAGIPVQITDNLYLIGLARGDLESRNVELLKNRGWLDVPLALTNGRVAKFSLEKGVSGERVIADAIAAWSQEK